MFANNNHANIHVRPILYYDDINPHSRAVLMLLNMLDVDVELRPIEMIKGEHLKPDYAKINPAHTVPCLVHKDIVVAGNAIFSYVCENNDTEKAKQLLAIKCYKRHCRVLSRLFFESQVLHRVHGQLMTDLMRKTIIETDVEFHSKKVESVYDTIDTYLKESPFVAGSVLTAADISFVACLGALDMMFPIAADAHRWEKLLDWFRRMRSLSVQKINVNGIEKQRRIVEYFAKFSFKSDIKRFTTSVRSSLIPRLSLQPIRCSTASQTIPAMRYNDANVDPLIASGPLEPQTVNSAAEGHVDEVYPEMQQNEAHPERRQNKVHPEMQQNSIDEVHKLTDEESFRTMHSAEVVNDIMPLDKYSIGVSEGLPEYPAPPTEDEVNELISNSKDTILTTERSSGGSQRDKPPVPPKRKRKMPIILEENTKNSQAKVSDELNKTFMDNVLEFSQRTGSSKPNIPLPIEPRTDSLSRLDGGVGYAHKKEVENKTKPSFAYIPQVIEILELNKAKTHTTLNATKITERIITKKSNSTSADKKSEFNEKRASTQKSLLPPNLPINCPQVALQYCRGVNLPLTALPAPPPTPENSSQDDMNEEEFPPPPSEVLLQSVRASGTNTRAASGVSSKMTTESLPRKKSNNFKSAAQSAPRTIRLLVSKKSDVKPGRKSAAEEHKSVQKCNRGCLVASGTKSPSSNISLCSLLRNKPRIDAGTTKKQDPKKAHTPTEKPTGLETAKSLVCTTNAIQKGAEKKQRALGGGQNKSKQKAALGSDNSQAVPNQSLSVASNKKSKIIVTQIKPFKISTSTPGDLEISVSTVVEKLDCNASNSTSEQNATQTVSMATNMSLDTTGRAVDVKSNSLSSEFAAKNSGTNGTKEISVQTQRQSELIPKGVSTATNTSFETTAKGQIPLNIAAENADHKKTKEILQQRPKSIVDNARTSSSKNAQQGASTSSHTKPPIAATQSKKEAKSLIQKQTAKTKIKVYPTKLQTRLQTKISQESKTFDSSPSRPNTRPYKAQSRVEAARKGAMKTKTMKRGTKGSNNSISTPTRPMSPRKTELEAASVLSSVQEITGAEQTSLASVLETNAPKTTKRAQVQSPHHITGHSPNQTPQSPLPAVSTLTQVVQAQTPTANPSPTINVQSASNCEGFNNTNVVAGVLVTVGLVAKTLLTLNEVAKSSAITTLPQPPPLPPPPVALQTEPKLKAPTLTPPIPPVKDVLPTPGTVAKALQSLSVVTSEAHPISETTKPLKKDTPKPKNIEEPVWPGSATRTTREKNNVRPLADILAATVRQANRNKADETTTNETEIKKETHQSYKKSEKLSDKMGKNVVPAAEQKMEANVEEEIIEAAAITDRPVEPQKLNQLVNTSQVHMADFPKRAQDLNTMRIIDSISGDSNTYKFLDASSASTTTVTGAQEPIALSTSVADSGNGLVQKENTLSLPSISDSQEQEISLLSPPAGTVNHTPTKSAANPLATPPTANTVQPSQELYRKIIDMALLNEQLESLEPTSLAAQPNIFITGYTPVNQQPTAQSFTGTGRTVGSRANAIRLHALSKNNGSALHGPSANVVISTFGYTPMSESDSTIEPLLPGYTLPAIPTAPLLPLNSKTYSTITTDLIQKQQAEPAVQPTGRSLSPRPREYRPYPTAHRSSSLSGGERRTT